jgi:hypothetical protein
MNRERAITLGAGFIFGAAVWLLSLRRSEPPPPSPAPQSGSTPAPIQRVNTPPAAAPPGDALLAGYATPQWTPEQDLTSVARAMDSFLLLVKTGNRGPLADNEDWAAAWQGTRAFQEPFVSPNHPILAQGTRLLDRWNTPLFIHALGGGNYDIRSAGPDRKLWTDDDVHRDADGSFRRGTNLNPASLARRRN